MQITANNSPNFMMDSDDQEEDYHVEAIRHWRYNMEGKCREFLIKWLGWPEEDNTWEPEEHLHCQDLVDIYVKSLNEKQLRYYNTPYPEKLTGFQRNATFVNCLGADGPHDSDDEDSSKIEKQKFYCLIQFEDSELAEEVTLKEFYEHHPAEAMAFCEKRILAVQR